MIDIIMAGVLGGLWRLSDGGFYRLPKGSSILGLLICLAVGYLSAGLLGLIPGAIAWRGLTQGYDGWDDMKVMIKRGMWVGPAAVAAVALPSQLGCPLPYSISWTAGLYLLIPLVANAVQPFLRQRIENRPIEFMEGALVIGGLALLGG